MNGDVLLLGIVGSTAYGMVHADSDIDRLGVFAVDPRRLFGLHPPTVKAQTRNGYDPDVTVHEAAKFARLCLDGNPTVSELLWLADELYEIRTELGDQLIGLRGSMLSGPRVRSSYLGYATQQFERLSNKGRFPDVPVSRIAKHARHLHRLVEQGTYLWTTGEMRVPVLSPRRTREFGERVAAGDLDLARSALARAELTFNQVATPLPDRPDEAPVEQWLQNVRLTAWKAT